MFLPSAVGLRHPTYATAFWYYNDGSRRNARGCTKGGSALGMGAPGQFVTILRILEPPQQFSRPEPFPGHPSPG